MTNKLTIITLNQENIVDFAEARNNALAKVKTPWVLFLDEDEKMSPELESEIHKAIEDSDFDAYYLKRRDIFLGCELKYGETGNASFIRLAKKEYGKWERPVHEVWTGSGKVGKLNNPLVHYPHKSISSFLSKIDHYSTIDSKFRKVHGIKSSLFKIAVYPFAKFFYNFIIKLGFLDGTPGVIMAAMMSFHSYLTWTKLFLLQQKKS